MCKLPDISICRHYNHTLILEDDKTLAYYNINTDVVLQVRGTKEFLLGGNPMDAGNLVDDNNYEEDGNLPKKARVIEGEKTDSKGVHSSESPSTLQAGVGSDDNGGGGDVVADYNITKRHSEEYHRKMDKLNSTFMSFLDDYANAPLLLFEGCEDYIKYAKEIEEKYRSLEPSTESSTRNSQEELEEDEEIGDPLCSFCGFNIPELDSRHVDVRHLVVTDKEMVHQISNFVFNGEQSEISFILQNELSSSNVSIGNKAVYTKKSIVTTLFESMDQPNVFTRDNILLIRNFSKVAWVGHFKSQAAQAKHKFLEKVNFMSKIDVSSPIFSATISDDNTIIPIENLVAESAQICFLEFLALKKGYMAFLQKYEQYKLVFNEMKLEMNNENSKLRQKIKSMATSMPNGKFPACPTPTTITTKYDFGANNNVTFCKGGSIVRALNVKMKNDKNLKGFVIGDPTLVVFSTDDTSVTSLPTPSISTSITSHAPMSLPKVNLGKRFADLHFYPRTTISKSRHTPRSSPCSICRNSGVDACIDSIRQNPFLAVFFCYGLDKNKYGVGASADENVPICQQCLGDCFKRADAYINDDINAGTLLHSYVRERYSSIGGIESDTSSSSSSTSTSSSSSSSSSSTSESSLPSVTRSHCKFNRALLSQQKYKVRTLQYMDDFVFTQLIQKGFCTSTELLTHLQSEDSTSCGWERNPSDKQDRMRTLKDLVNTYIIPMWTNVCTDVIYLANEKTAMKNERAQNTTLGTLFYTGFRSGAVDEMKSHLYSSSEGISAIVEKMRCELVTRAERDFVKLKNATEEKDVIEMLSKTPEMVMQELLQNDCNKYPVISDFLTKVIEKFKRNSNQYVAAMSLLNAMTYIFTGKNISIISGQPLISLTHHQLGKTVSNELLQHIGWTLHSKKLKQILGKLEKKMIVDFDLLDYGRVDPISKQVTDYLELLIGKSVQYELMSNVGEHSEGIVQSFLYDISTEDPHSKNNKVSIVIKSNTGVELVIDLNAVKDIRLVEDMNNNSFIIKVIVLQIDNVNRYWSSELRTKPKVENLIAVILITVRVPLSLSELLELKRNNCIVFNSSFITGANQAFEHKDSYQEIASRENIEQCMPEIKKRINLILANQRVYTEAMAKFNMDIEKRAQDKAEKEKEKMGPQVDGVPDLEMEINENADIDETLKEELSKSKPSCKLAKEVLNTCRNAIREHTCNNESDQLCQNQIEILNVNLYTAGTSTSMQILPTLLDLLNRTQRWWDDGNVVFIGGDQQIHKHITELVESQKDNHPEIKQLFPLDGLVYYFF